MNYVLMLNECGIFNVRAENGVGHSPGCVCLRVWTRLSSVGRKLEKDECSPLTSFTEVTARWDHDIQLLLQGQLPLPGVLRPAASAPSPVQSVPPSPGPALISGAPGPGHWHGDHCPLLPLLLLCDHLPLSVRHGHGQPGVRPLRPLDIWSHFCPCQHKWTWSETSKVHTCCSICPTTL